MEMSRKLRIKKAPIYGELNDICSIHRVFAGATTSGTPKLAFARFGEPLTSTPRTKTMLLSFDERLLRNLHLIRGSASCTIPLSGRQDNVVRLFYNAHFSAQKQVYPRADKENFHAEIKPQHNDDY